MEKRMLPGNIASVKRLALAFAVIFITGIPQKIFSQCFNPVIFNEAGTITPYANLGGAFQTVNTGPGTVVFSNVHNGGIYRYSNCNTNATWGHDTQITGSTTGSALLFYDDDNGPQCNGGNTRASVDWTSNFTGTVDINENVYYCLGYQGSGSANSTVLDYKCTGPGDPSVFGNGLWILYGYNTGDASGGSSSWADSYSGYIDAIPGLSFNSHTYWGDAGSPSDYSGFLGCHIRPDNHSWSLKRQNFPCGIYQIDIPFHDDRYELYINGSLVASQTAATTTLLPNVWTGLLTTTSTVEFRVSEGGGTSNGAITITNVTTPINGGSISANQTVCVGGDPVAFTNVSSASGGAGSYTYTWFQQDNCTGGGTNIGSGLTYDPPAGIPNTRCYSRLATDQCGSYDYTAPVTVTVVPDPTVSSPSFTNSSICIGGSSNVSVTSSGGTGTISYQWQYFNGATWNNVVNNTPAGATYTNSATATMTISGITVAGSDQYRCNVSATGSDCNTATSTTGTLTVVADPSVTAPSFTNSTICAGGSSNVSVTASNGTGAISYQWQYDNGGTWVNVTAGLPTGSAYVNATSATMGISGITATGSYNYQCIVSASGSGCDPVTSTTGTITVVADPTVSIPVYTNSTICVGGSSNVSVTASNGTGTINYQWQYFNGATWNNVVNNTPAGATYTNATTATMTISGITSAGSDQYRCNVSATGSGCDPVSSSGVALTVVSDPTVTAPSFSNSSICAGGSSDVSVTASNGTGTISYQWQYFNGATWNNVVNNTPVGATYTNATAATMTISGITGAGSDQYRCNVSATGSGCDPISSVAGTLTVISDLLVTSTNITNASICAGGLTDVSILTSGGSGTISYQWQYNNGGTWINVTAGIPTGAAYVNNTSATMTISGITAAGSYQYQCIVSASGSGCDPVTSSALNLTVVPDLSVSTPLFTNSTICSGGLSDVSVTPSNGTGTLGYQWQYFNGATWNNVVNATPAGAVYANANTATLSISGITPTSTYQYHCIVTASGSGCDPVTSNAGTLTIVPDPSISITGGGTFCVSGSSLLTATASGGTGTLTYQWQQSPDGVGFTDISGANASTYTTPSHNATIYYQCVYSATGSGCDPATSNIVIDSIVPAIANNLIPNYQKFCLNGDPVIIIGNTVSGGTGVYTYLWEQSTNGGVSWTPASGTNNLADYDPPYTTTTIRYHRIVYSSVCSSTSNEALILVLPLPQVTGVTSTDALCYATPTGTITVTGSTANGSVYYSDNGGTSYQVPGLFSNLLTGNYNIFIRDDSSCVNNYVGNPVFINQPDSLKFTTSSTDASCANVFDGSITITAIGGVTPYSYSLNGGPSQSGNVFSGLAAGSYYVQVIDAHGCATGSTVIINNSYIVSVSIVSQTNVSCYGGTDGTVTVDITGGTPPYSYSINGVQFVPTSTFSGLSAGNHLVTLRDSKGCTDFLNVVITQPNLLQATLDSVKNIGCSGGSTGAVYISVTGGTPGYSFVWSNGATTEDITGLTAGTYNVAITDSKGCSTSTGVTLSQPLPLFLNVASYHNLNCYNDSSGSVDITVSGGVPPYSFAWSNGAITEDVLNLKANTYSVTITDNNGCQQNISQVISEPSLLTSGSVVTNLTCYGSNNGSIDLTASGGTLPYAYLWSNGSTLEDLSALSAGTYTVVITDAHGCNTSNTSVVTQPNALTLSTVVTNISCSGNSTGSIDLTVTGGTGAYTYAWTGGGATEDTSGLVAGTYTVTVTDANNCTATISATISQPSQPLSGSLSETDVTCNGAGDGTVNLTLIGGTQPYSYLWSNGVLTEDLTGLGPNTYTVTATDANGCSFVDGILVSEPAPLVAGIQGTNVSCFGGNNGAADLTVTGGNGGYTYLWSNFAVTEDLTGLTAGNYVVIVNDSKGCQAITSVVITQPAQLVVTGTATNILCNGGNNGAIDITVAGGTTPYGYEWTGGGATEDTSGLVAGTYNVTVTDANSCTATASFTLTQPAALSLSGVVTAVTCNGANNGDINITVGGGAIPYGFAWSNGAVTEDIHGISGGAYSVTVTDANGCTITASYIISEPSAITSSIVGTNVTCNGASNGAADLTVGGGTPPYTYLWSTFQSTEDLSNIGGGMYYVIITDANGCQKRDSVLITEPAALVLTTNVTNVLCHGAATGAIDLTVTGGTGSYGYAWTGGGATEDTSGLVAGTYTVTVTDGNGCTATASATITEPAGLVLNATTTNVGCAGGANGSVDITVQGGVFPYGFAWSNGAVTEDIHGISGGTYSVTVTDANGCTITASYIISEPSAITSSIVGTNVTCNGASNGAADLTVGGGTPPYTYLWSTFQSTEDLSNIGGGMYYVIITDANGCQKRDSVLITEPAALVLTTNVTNVLCHGAATGAIDLTVTGGTGSYGYAWSNGATVITQDLSNVVAGTYTVTVTDGNGCTATASATITEPAGLVLNATTTNVGCAGGANGSVDITVQGGVFPYGFAWSNGAVTEDIHGISGGTYSVTVTDANGCTITASYIISEPSAITSSIVGTNVTCNGASNGSADLTVGGGTPPYTYLWSTFQSTEDLSNIGGGMYYVIITDANGCQKRDSVLITEPAALVLTTNVTNVLCHGAATGAIDLTVTGGTGSYGYAWTGGGATEDTSGLVAGTYTVTVTDGNGCTATASATITEPAGLVLNATTTNVGCAGGANGSVDITVQGGVFPYGFAWSNGAVTEDIHGISGGTYSVTVTDANGCTITASYIISEPSAITSSIVGTNVLCFSGNDGTATLTVSGGTPAYSFLWNNFHSTQNLTGLTAGTYFVIITDANGCQKRDSVVITQPAPLVLTTVVTNVLCNGDATGGIDLTVTGGTAAYDYTWSNGASTQDLTNVVAGTYCVTVKDANNCTATVCATISQPNTLVLTGTATNVHCFGGQDGQVNITVVGGTLPYTFAWSNGPTTEDIQNLIAGTYSVTVIDAHACSATASYTITAPADITSSIVGVNVTCHGANNGSATLAVGGGVTPYTFMWSNFQVSQSISNLGGGVYYVIITDANGCTHRDSVVIDEPAPIILSLQVTQISCFNANDGAIDLSVAGGTTPYQYNWSNGATTEDVSNLSGATYCVTVTDNHLCTASICQLIINPSNISTNAVIHNPVCFGDVNGSIDLIATGGTPNYTYAWNTGDLTEDISGIGAGVYAITITDAHSCVRVDSFVVTEPSALYTSGFIHNVTCFGLHNGFVDITAYGGTLPYSYTWSTGQSTEDIGTLAGGTYFVTVTDAHGCQVVSLYQVVEPTVLTLSITTTNVSCFNGTDGTITSHPGGGSVPYEYLWDDFATDSLRDGLSAGHYVLMLSDSNGCHTFDSVDITQPTEMQITALVSDATCFGSATGAVDVSVTGGTPSYTYFWTSGSTQQDLNAVAAGPYTVTVTDVNQCQKTADFTVHQPSEINLTLLMNKPTCNGASNGSMSVVAIQGVTPYTYAWSTQPVQTTATASDLFAGSYTVTVTDAHNCTAAATDSLIGPTKIDVSTLSTGSRCFANASGIVATTVTGGLPPYVYQLNGVTQDSSVFHGLAPGHYVILVTDANSCMGTSAFNIASPGQISVHLAATEQIILTGMQTQLVATAVADTTIIGYMWNPDSLMDYSICGDPTNCPNPFAAPRSSTIFTVTVMNADSCTASDTITIYVSNSLSAFVPTAFTPNGDGLNDRFEFDILGATNIDVEIFNRWGQAVYINHAQQNGITGNNGWDGKVDGKDAPYDTYVWKMKVTYFDGTVKDNTGTVTLMK